MRTFHHCRRILSDREAGSSLLGLAGVLTIFAAGPTALLPTPSSAELLWPGVFLGLGILLGAGWLALQRHPCRALGLVPAGVTLLTVALVWVTLAAPGEAPVVLWLLFGMGGGLACGPLARAYQCALPGELRAAGLLVLGLATLIAAAVGVGCGAGVVGVDWLQCVLSVIAGAAALVAWWWYFREVLEQAVEVLVWPFYDIRGHGPGRGRVPLCGPVLVLANHAAYADPFWLAKHLPRRVIPMMTSVFFDLPVIRWLMTRVVHGIRVPKSEYRREAPELNEAIAVLDRGECLIIFPEGQVRKKEEQLLRPFARGVWHILAARPSTPVVVCWIEGNWGSFFSYYHGAPGKGKRLDWRRPIDVYYSDPKTLPPELLADQRATRSYLWRRCLEGRRALGLDTPLVEELVGSEGE